MLSIEPSLSSARCFDELMGRDVQQCQVHLGSGDTAEMGTTVTCNLKGYLLSAGDDNDSKTKLEPAFEDLNNQSFTIGESDAIPGLELALRHSRVGDVFIVRISSRFAYGSVGRQRVRISATQNKSFGVESSRPKEAVVDVGQTDTENAISYSEAIPGDADLEYEVEVIRHLAAGCLDGEFIYSFTGSKELPHDEIHRQQLLSMFDLLQRKEAGNRWFSYGDFQRAARAYSKGTKVADTYFNHQRSTDSEIVGTPPDFNEASAHQKRLGDSLEKAIVDAYVSCLNNLSACHLKLGEHLKAKDLCIKVLEFDEKNTKALLRAARACLSLHLFEESELCLKRLLEIVPADSPAALAGRAQRQLLKKAQQKYRDDSKRIASNIAKNLFREGEKVTEQEDCGTFSSAANSSMIVVQEPSTTIIAASSEAEGNGAADTHKKIETDSGRGYFHVLLLTSVVVLFASLVTVYFLK